MQLNTLNAAYNCCKRNCMVCGGCLASEGMDCFSCFQLLNVHLRRICHKVNKLCSFIIFMLKNRNWCQGVHGHFIPLELIFIINFFLVYMWFDYMWSACDQCFIIWIKTNPLQITNFLFHNLRTSELAQNNKFDQNSTLLSLLKQWPLT